MMNEVNSIKPPARLNLL